jgi:hypothetical protein
MTDNPRATRPTHRQAASGEESISTSSEYGLLATLGKIAGIGGISVGVLLILFLNFIRQKFLPNLEPAQGYSLLLLFMIFTFGVAVCGLTVWASQMKAGGRLLIVLLLSFALVMSALGAYVVTGAKEELKSNTQAKASQLPAYVAPESTRFQLHENAQGAFDTAYKKFRAGVDTSSNVIRAHEKLIDTDIGLSATHQERLVVYQTALEFAKKFEAEVDQMIKVGVISPGDLFEVKRHRTDAEVALAREQSAVR